MTSKLPTAPCEALAELAVKTPANAPDPLPSTQPPDAAPEAAGGQRGAITEGFTSILTPREPLRWPGRTDVITSPLFIQAIATNLSFTQRTRWEKRQSAL